MEQRRRDEMKEEVGLAFVYLLTSKTILASFLFFSFLLVLSLSFFFLLGCTGIESVRLYCVLCTASPFEAGRVEKNWCPCYSKDLRNSWLAFIHGIAMLD